MTPPTIPRGRCQCGCGRVTPIASRTKTARGEKKGEPLRYCHGHNLTRLQGTQWRQRQTTKD